MKRDLPEFPCKVINENIMKKSMSGNKISFCAILKSPVVYFSFDVLCTIMHNNIDILNFHTHIDKFQFTSTLHVFKCIFVLTLINMISHFFICQINSYICCSATAS